MSAIDISLFQGIAGDLLRQYKYTLENINTGIHMNIFYLLGKALSLWLNLKQFLIKTVNKN